MSERNAETITLFGGSSTGPVAAGFVEFFDSRQMAVQLNVVPSYADSGGGVGKIRQVVPAAPGFADEAKTIASIGQNASVRTALQGPRFNAVSTSDDIQRRNDALLLALEQGGDIDTQEAARTLEHAVALAKEWPRILPSQSYINLARYALWAAHDSDLEASARAFSSWLKVPDNVRIYPTSPKAHHLILEDAKTGARVVGEAAVDEYQVTDPDTISIKLVGPGGEEPQPNRHTQDALANSHFAVVVPGSIFTSLLPSLLLYRGDIAALQNDEGVLAVLLNLCREPTTPSLTVSRHLGVLARHGFEADCAFRNTDRLPNGVIPIHDDRDLTASDIVMYGASLLKAGLIQYDAHDAVAAAGLRRPVEHDGVRLAEVVAQELIIPGTKRSQLKAV